VTDGLKLGLNLGRWTRPADATEAVLVAERLGYDCVWTSEAYGSDALTPLAWYGARTSRIKLGALMQLGARTPAAVAMAAMTMDWLSGGRFLIGFGVSNPQVVEGWYGADFSRPVARTREHVELVRRMLRRDAPVTNPGPHYPLPHAGGTGFGKPLLLEVRPKRPQIPVYLAALGPANVALAAEIADGWLPTLVHPERSWSLYPAMAGNTRPGFDIAALVTVEVTNDVAAALENVRLSTALYVGGFGARGRNFYFDAICRMGYADEAHRIRELYLGGDLDEAADAVPTELADAMSLVGPIGRITERLELWRKSPATTLLVTGARDEPTLRAIRDALAAGG
jgi:F420-dependent oxidoreductase-like protein